MTSVLNGFERLANAVQVALIGDPKMDDIAALRRTALAAGKPDLILSIVAPGTDLPAGHPATGKGQVEGKATAYVCVGSVCGLPVTDAAGLSDALAAV